MSENLPQKSKPKKNPSFRWIPFDPNKGYRQKRPPIHKQVLVLISEHALPTGGAAPQGVAVGYRKDAAGDKSSPYFVVPGSALLNGGKVIAWADVLPDDYQRPEPFTKVYQ